MFLPQWNSPLQTEIFSSNCRAQERNCERVELWSCALYRLHWQQRAGACDGKKVFADLNVISISLYQVSSSLWDCPVNCPFAALAQQWVTQKKHVQWKTAISTATWTEGSTWLLISSHLWPVDPWSSFRRVPKSLEAFCLLEVPLYLSASKFILDKTDLTWSLLCNKKNLFAPCHGVSNSDLMVFAAQRQGFAGSAPLETEKIPPSKHGHCQILYCWSWCLKAKWQGPDLFGLQWLELSARVFGWVRFDGTKLVPLYTPNISIKIL